ncbi:bifunctional phosphopantothenoylcysteine decarboxylase/phosphopantothenate--cysteine ligase CoaBC [Flammeovirga kamogawensis]|uniref:Coenzyme A biosynthesis bifunctional protein CoaBC n=1 Tax=Flammeovirga kamogawensis TaxID=373891 RepID=A0ABX8GUE8_9BACT|nr:bifunctional phosphopantothenoylcysteine decarboxylase/phosphopantothenate--cysteine ligase CoaBC [Flammeovirga kamogawensis]MBB6459731.1 phosphopantothenoylcysteine decarboxylase/phosphopantothenate--cysteine ligase [Flammeovirga kamogawensis]QWG07210.1 bifunctional phosphopantothenoylcysteine decarboxylase/phosphopantothenate--cysteine ligase CoaBC [Flammeovirga kamogawensis]TRX69030.1 bifunctional phosphopantothenoylcysteine decarboxylase/phosphopantothenate--cysteine ligase CoaBC [Flammeo
MDSILKGKKILIGVTGGIAAYKIALLVRLFKKQKAEVQVIMTEAAKQFITPVTLSTLSENPVLTQYANEETGEWNSHVKLGLWADLMIIAPATANTMAKMANGLCDNLLMATYLSARCPVMIAPAMDLDMFVHPSTTRNINILTSYGHLIVDAEEGELASGLVGKGRMAEPEHILDAVTSFFSPKKELPLSGKKAIITAGPTKEKIDPVRFITNGSTGKMGYAIAEELAQQGAEVTIISGPVQVCASNNINIIPVASAEDMYKAVDSIFDTADICIFTAAVADYTPLNYSDSKIKKKDGDLDIKMKRTIDIAKTMGERKKEHQITVGFALETDNELANAKGKLTKKNVDFVVLNSLKEKGAGFGHDTNKVVIVSADKTKELPLLSKVEVAEHIVKEIILRKK